LFGEFFNGRETLLVFAAGEKQDLIRDAGEPTRQRLALMAPDVPGGDHEDFAGFCRDIGRGAADQAPLDDRGIALPGRLHAKRKHTNFEAQAFLPGGFLLGATAKSSRIPIRPTLPRPKASDRVETTRHEPRRSIAVRVPA